jgi:hypothetical protein
LKEVHTRTEDDLEDAAAAAALFYYALFCSNLVCSAPLWSDLMMMMMMTMMTMINALPTELSDRPI